MLRMLGRLMWVAVGAVGLKAWEASENQRQGGSSGNRSGSRSRSRSTGGSSND